MNRRFTTRLRRRPAGLIGLAIPLMLGLPGPAAAQLGTIRDLSSYFVFAQTRAQVKDLTLEGACNIGVNCSNPSVNSPCGTLSINNAVFDTDAILVASRILNSGFGTLPRVLSEQDVPNCGRAAPRTFGQRFTPPILGDADGDGNPSCGSNCTPDFGDLERACGFPAEPITCDSTQSLLALPGVDCVPSGLDAVPGNGRCDLAQGAYGSLTALDKSNLELGGGEYDFCDFNVGSQVHVAVDAPTTLRVSFPGGFNISNLSSVTGGCGDLKVLVQGGGDVTFGKSAQIAADVCAPESHMTLGHGNRLQGHFVADEVTGDQGNVGVCCDAAH